MKITSDWLTDPVAQRVAGMLTDAGYQAFFVGGCVRNTLLGAPVSDLDLTTDAHPNRVMELAQGIGLAAHPTGIDHGTVTVVAQGVPFEVTTFRKDVETDGRRAVVAFAETAREDAQRRDFTMNALYCAPDGQITDPTGGLADLAARRFRFIGDPHARIQEDYLRILRFFRFFAWYGRDLDPDGLAACAEHADGLTRLSLERVTAELTKLLSAPNPAPAVASMQHAGVLQQVLTAPDVTPLARLVHFEEMSGLAPSPMRRLASFAMDAPDRLRLSKRDAATYTLLRTNLFSDTTPAALGQYHGEPVATDVILLRAALSETPPNATDLAAARAGAKAQFPVRAKDLPATLQGREIGSALSTLKSAWIESGFTLSREELLKRL